MPAVQVKPDPQPIAYLITCPVCHQLPAVRLNPEQMFCETKGCPAFKFDATQPATEQLAAAHRLNLSGQGPTDQGFEPVTAHPLDPDQVAARNRDPDWCRQAARIRHDLHQWGCMCAGECPVCDSDLPLTPGQEDDIKRIFDAMYRRHVPKAFPAVTDIRPIQETFELIGALYGIPGINHTRQLALARTSRL